MNINSKVGSYYSARDIVEAALTATPCTLKDVRKRSQLRELSDARKVAIYCFYWFKPYIDHGDPSKLARELNLKNGVTYHHHKGAKELVKIDPQFRAVVNAAQRAVNNKLITIGQWKEINQ